ncbi:acyl-[acyl-carrier-protein] thioesterase [Lacticaseibacillus saniviri]
MEYSEQYRVPFFFGTTKGTISLSTLVNIMLLTSEHQLDEHDAGVPALAELGAGWVITQYHITVNRMPEVEELVEVGTAARSYNRFLTYRDYWINDADGNRLATIEGTWVMMDLETRKLLPIKAEIVNRVGAEEATTVKRFPRIQKIENETIRAPYRVRYFDIDSNGHVNNAHYFDWMEDSLGAEWLQQHELVSIDIRYEREVAYGDEAPIAVAELVSETETRHKIMSGDVVNAEAQMTWRSL